MWARHRYTRITFADRVEYETAYRPCQYSAAFHLYPQMYRSFSIHEIVSSKTKFFYIKTTKKTQAVNSQLITIKRAESVLLKTRGYCRYKNERDFLISARNIRLDSIIICFEFFYKFTENYRFRYDIDIELTLIHELPISLNWYHSLI